MVNLKDFDKEIHEMAKFYIDLPEKVEAEADKYYAILGKKSSEKILELVKKYHSNPKNTYLKQLHANLMTLTRGIEKFNDEAIESKHETYGKLRYQIFEYIEKKVKW
jgi:hypothetical protein